MKWLPLQLTAREYAIKLSVIKLCLRGDLETDAFRNGFLIIHAVLSRLFNATDNLKASRATHWFLDINKSFTDLKSGDKSLFWHVLKKIFCDQFYF